MLAELRAISTRYLSAPGAPVPDSLLPAVAVSLHLRPSDPASPRLGTLSVHVYTWRSATRQHQTLFAPWDEWSLARQRELFPLSRTMRLLMGQGRGQGQGGFAQLQAEVDELCASGAADKTRSINALLSFTETGMCGGRPKHSCSGAARATLALTVWVPRCGCLGVHVCHVHRVVIWM